MKTSWKTTFWSRGKSSEKMGQTSQKSGRTSEKSTPTSERSGQTSEKYGGTSIEICKGGRWGQTTVRDMCNLPRNMIYMFADKTSASSQLRDNNIMLSKSIPARTGQLGNPKTRQILLRTPGRFSEAKPPLHTPAGLVQLGYT